MTIEKLLKTNVNEHIEKKNGLSYLSWAWAWSEALKADPAATYKVEMFGDKCYMEINGTAMVWVTVTMFGKQMTCQLPVMDYRNKAIPEPDAFAVNTAIMRCMTKALALHGLGLYIYSGEDIFGDGADPFTNAAKLLEESKTIDELRVAFKQGLKTLTSLADKRAFSKIKDAMKEQIDKAKAMKEQIDGTTNS